jgi:hypothetical protein
MSRGRPKGEKESNEPIHWKAGQREAREVRDRVAEELAGALQDRDQTGSLALVRRRAGQLSEAVQRGDRMVERAATWELALACVQHVVGLDLMQRRESVRERARAG